MKIQKLAAIPILMGPEDTHVFANVDTAKMNIHVWRYKLAQVNVGAYNAIRVTSLIQGR